MRLGTAGLMGGALAVFFWGAVLLGAGAARAQGDSERITQLEQEIAAIKAQVAALQAAAFVEQQAAVAEVERRLEVLAAEVEKLKLGEAAAPAPTPTLGLGPSASKVYRSPRGVSIGGYGELLYQNFSSIRQDAAPAGAEDRLDLRRAVVYFGYKWSDRYLFNSEIEFEHAVSAADRSGETSVEFAYVDALWRPRLNGRAGLILMPVGLINELHEPTVFLGAQRPGVEELILPTTWRELGFGIFGDVGKFSYRTFLVNGMDASRFSAAGGLAEGKQEGSLAKARDFAWVGRLDYTATPGLLVGVSAYAGGAGQGLRGVAGRAIAARTTIGEAHLDWKLRGWQVRALAARARVSEVAALDQALGLAGADSIGQELAGGYLEAGYDLFARWPHGERALIPFVRAESYDTQKRVPAGFARDPANRVQTWTLGFAYKPFDQLIVKIDAQRARNDARAGGDQLNAALGYIF